MTLLYVFCKAISLVIFAVTEMMFLRAILSFFRGPEDSRFLYFLTVLTEPFIVPMRALLSLLGIEDDGPFDIGFFVTYLILVLAGSLLPTI